MHAVPATHATQAPRPSHTPIAHGLPAGALACATHEGAVPPHTIEPARHGSGGVQEAPSVHEKHRPAVLQTEPVGHAPHEPPHRSSPHSRPVHIGAHAPASAPVSTPVSEATSEALSRDASVRRPPSGIGITSTLGVVHCPSSPQVCPRSSQNREMVHGTLSSAQRAGGLTNAAQAAGMNSRTNDGVRGTNRNRAVRCAIETGCPGAAGASCNSASRTTGPSFSPVPANTVNDAGKPKSSAPPVRVHALGCALIERVVPEDATTRSDNTRSRASVSTTTRTDVEGVVHEVSPVDAVAASAAKSALAKARPLCLLTIKANRITIIPAIYEGANRSERERPDGGHEGDRFVACRVRFGTADGPRAV